MALLSSFGLLSKPAIVAGSAAVCVAAAVGSYILIFDAENTPVPVVQSAGETTPPVELAVDTSGLRISPSEAAPNVSTVVLGKKFGTTDETGGTAPDVGTEVAALANPDTGTAETAIVGDGNDLAVSATVVGGQVVASADTDAVRLDTASAGVPVVGGGSPEISSATRPSIDLVRIDKLGAAVVAGKSEPGQALQVIIEGVVIAEVKADDKGRFVALFDVPASQDPQMLTLLASGADGKAVFSRESVVVMGREVVTTNAPDADSVIEVVEDVAPAVIIASEEGIKVVQPVTFSEQAPEALANITIDLISYDESGEVILTGRGSADKHVRVYINDQPIKTEEIGADGSWKLALPEVDPGRYTLRVDEIDSAGQVTSRVETPFQKEQAEDVRRTASAADLSEASSGERLPEIDKVTIQTGATLWALAKANYGDGALYVQIFQANKEFIRNPDLIYPGQVFTIPE